MVLAFVCLSISMYAYDFEVDGIYYDVKSLEDMTCDVVGCSSDVNELTIPATIQLNGRELKVCDIREAAFENNSALTKIIFNPGLTAEIGNNAFSGCKNLSAVNLNDVRAIGEKSFFDCPKIKKIVFPGQLQNIGSAAFALSNKDSYYGIDVSFEEGNEILHGYEPTTASDWVFYNRKIVNVHLNRDIENFGNTWTDLSNLSIGPKVSKFPSYMGNNLINVDLSTTNIIEICDYAFYGYESKSISLPLKLQKIGDRAFEFSALTSIVLPETLQKIGNEAFWGSDLENIVLPNSIISIGESCFLACKKLTDISIPGSLSKIPPKAFDECSYLTSVDIKDGVEYIEDMAFENCYRLKNVRLSNTLKKIGNSAFSETNLQSIVIPASVDTICAKALGEALERITFEPSNKPLYFYSDVINMQSFGSSKYHYSYGEACAEPYVCTAYYQSPFIQNSLKEISLGRPLVTLSYLYGKNDELPGEDIVSKSYKVINRTYSHLMGVSNSELQKITIYEDNDNPFELRDALESHYTHYDNSYERHLYIDEHNDITNFAPVLSAGKLTKLTEIQCMRETPPEILEDFPLGVYMAAKVYVPQGALNNYKNAPYWKNFWSIEESDFIVKVSDVELNESEMTLNEGQSATLKATITPDTANNTTLSWTSSNEAVATVTQDGKVTAISKGMAVITAKSTDDSNVSASCTVNVVRLVSSIQIDPTTVTLKVGEQATINAYALPADATNPTLNWSSYNSTVASVENGVVTAIKEGSTIIFVETTDGSNISERCRVIVKKRSAIDSVSTDEIEVSVSNGTINITNVPVNQMIQILQTNGTIVKEQISTGEVISYQPANKGVYIIVVGNETFKVVI